MKGMVVNLLLTVYKNSVSTLHKILCDSVSITKLWNAAYSTKFVERILKIVKKKNSLNSSCSSASPFP